MEPTKTLKKKLRKCLTVSTSLLLCACSCFPTEKELDVRPKQILQRLGKCKQYKIVDFKTFKFEFEKDLPLDQCLVDGFFVLTDDEVVALRKAANKTRDCVEKKCHGGNNGN